MICRGKTLLHTCALVLVFFASCSRKTEPEPPAQPNPPARSQRQDLNVVLITIDTLRTDYLSCYGGKAVSTPNIDGLAARGVRFAQAVAQVPLTAPSHASILTGTYPQLHNVRDMGGFVMNASLPTLATLLAQNGFETAAFVGAAVLHHHYGLNRGFGLYADNMKDETGGKKLPGVVGEIRAETVTHRTLAWLEKHLEAKPSKRFFLWAHYFDPHFPYDPPEPHRARNPKSPYAGEVAYTDEQIGRVLRWISEKGIQDRTLVVLASDHGESLGEHGEYTHGVFLYDSTMRIALIVGGPAVPEGRVVQHQVRSIDIMPTIADYLGISPGEKAQGVTLMPAILEGKKTRSNYSYMETIYPKTRLGWSELRAMRTDGWKFIVAPKPELYRLDEDRSENRNVVDRFPVDADRLQKQVWEVAGGPESLGELQHQPIDDERKRELAALGYVSAGHRKLRIDMSGPDPKDRVGILEILERATEAMNHDRFSVAAALLAKIARADPTNPLIHTQLGECYQRLGQFARAEQVYQAAIRNKADTDHTHAELGEIQIRLGNLNLAVRSMEQAAKLNPANLDNLNNLANAYLQSGQLDEAQRVLKAMLAQNDRSAAAHNLFGILQIQRGRAAEARAHFERAVEFNPGLTEAYMNLGLLAQNAGESKRAVIYYKRFLKLAKPDKYGEIIPKVKAAIADLESNQ